MPLYLDQPSCASPPLSPRARKEGKVRLSSRMIPLNRSYEPDTRMKLYGETDNGIKAVLFLNDSLQGLMELCLLPTMLGYAEVDTEAGKCGLLQEAGMMVWAGSYCMGLASKLSEGTSPALMH